MVYLSRISIISNDGKEANTIYNVKAKALVIKCVSKLKALALRPNETCIPSYCVFGGSETFEIAKIVLIESTFRKGPRSLHSGIFIYWRPPLCILFSIILVFLYLGPC